MTGQTICLCMIVKDEASVIARCLASARPLIDHYLVVDTGSTDGTQAVVRQALAGLPGTLVERPWVDFGHNRSEALALARPLADYALIIDADDELVLPPAFVRPALDADAYAFDIHNRHITYRRTQLVSNALAWRYVGVLHELLVSPGALSVGHLPIAMRCNQDGRRRRDPSVFRNDVAVLERALEAERQPGLVSRYTFYLAQSYRDCGDYERAIDAYLRRATQGFWVQEVFVSLYYAARMMEVRGRDFAEIIATYRRATAACPTRAEAAHAASRLCRLKGRHEDGYAIAKPAIAIQAPADGLFVEQWIYAYGLLDEFAVHAYRLGRYAESRDACRELLTRSALPAGTRERIAANARVANERLAERASTIAATVQSAPTASGAWPVLDSRLTSPSPPDA